MATRLAAKTRTSRRFLREITATNAAPVHERGRSPYRINTIGSNRSASCPSFGASSTKTYRSGPRPQKTSSTQSRQPSSPSRRPPELPPEPPSRWSLTSLMMRFLKRFGHVLAPNGSTADSLAYRLLFLVIFATEKITKKSMAPEKASAMTRACKPVDGTAAFHRPLTNWATPATTPRVESMRAHVQKPLSWSISYSLSRRG